MVTKLAHPNMQEGVFEVGTMVSHVPRLLEARGWGAMDLVRRGLSVDTAYRLQNGDTNITMSTLIQLCDMFEVESVSDVMEYRRDEQE